MVEILYGKPVAEKLEEKIREDLKEIGSKGIVPTLLIIKVGENPEGESYADSVERFFKKVRINVERRNLEEDIPSSDFKKEMEEISEDNNIHGVLILRPFPVHLEKEKVYQLIPPSKDIEGLSYQNLGKIIYGEDTFHPCTAQAVIELIDFYNISLEGKNVVLVGRSISVGRPLALLLLHKNATLSICHSRTKNLSFYTKMADVLVVAVGKAGMITPDMVNENAVVVDVGTNVVEGKLVGDVDFDRVKNKVKSITPVPGGIGIITTRVLALNLLKAVRKDETGD
ncbi:MAG TPA: bifunctional 5,10-methylenetetrahydrofolate dehydrogenase/5,10-methenyltetrahydrofolate cyclohydrolase [Dictyoglomaceae bacterium]|nr:bifunctional 5,10-methylenetetrahydrofolate dehydrogenase/5,10-methenyltetrahydrofolate cyclohydrolase [Dictyoglomaceae bacterium]HOL39666.1 bifunctional 5,10-methylenetetrahydrofolate dehydrogenase/5,10-methenyltetrahydrofolate cyclohydrolase [Dictyoglomaceae bacterium]HOP94798.1 bifunctional 5,10-methylenetetrahydrofolate dehydrogenase/5,10-methenyltetrahydrofolate cyclohydrolase [Dictyoglomaceae bacterium]HPP16065.1 bifunctional 5,10-methylenetetrahydrofolate dehydrogenase/5,10-methenyltet